MPNTTLEDVYQTELAYYRQLTEELSRSFPELSFMVGERDADISVEKVLQGASLLTGRLRYRIQDDFPQIIQSLYARLWPQFLRPLPASALVEFTPYEDAIQQSQKLVAGTPVEAKPARRTNDPDAPLTSCRFSTSYETYVHPLTIDNVVLDKNHPADWLLRIRFKFGGGASLSNLDKGGISIHFVGDKDAASTLYYWMVRFAGRVEVRDLGGKTLAWLRRGCIRPLGLEAEQALANCSPTPLDGLRLLEEYFILPEKFLGIQLSGLAETGIDDLEDDFELAIHLGRPPGKPAIETSLFRLGCVPVINVGPAQELSLPVLDGVSEYPVISESGAIYDVTRVGGHHAQTGEWIEFEPLIGADYYTTRKGRPYYRVRRLGDGIGGVGVFLEIVNHKGEPWQPPTEEMVVWHQQTDGEIPLRLGKGDISESASESPEFLQFTNLTPPAPPRDIELGRDRYWKLVAHFTMHPDDLASVNGLTQLLREARAGRRVGAPRIIGVSTDDATYLDEQSIVPLRQIQIQIDDAIFSSEGEFYLFANILHYLFERKPGTNTLNEVTVRGQNTDTSFTFEPR